MRFGSVCSGIEAASAAWGVLGWRAAWFSEIEPFPCAVLAHHYPDVPNLGDMTTLPDRILAGKVEAPDVFCGGTPCQAFSVAGLRRSLDDARGNLSLTFCEIADAIDDVRLAGGEPASIVFWENVPGVLSTRDNAFGCFLARLCGGDEPLHAPDGWPDAGCVSGPARTAAWRVLDAQYFGLAQRRRRVFVVASARDGFDPAAVLLEFKGVRRDSAPSREAREGTARGVATGAGGGGQGGVMSAFGGGQNCAETDVSTALSAHPGGSRLDFQTETFVAHTLRGEGFDASKDGTGRGTPLVPVAMPEIAGTMKACKDSGGWSNSADHAAAGYMVPVTFRADAMREGAAKTPSPDAEGRVRLRDPGMGMYEDIAPTLDCGAAHGVAHAFDARQSYVLQYGDKTGPLDTDGYSVGVLAFSSKDHGADATADLAPTLRAMNHADSHANGGGQMAVCIKGAAIGRKPEAGPQYGELLTEIAYTQNCVDVHGVLTPAMQVRRLTPTECERLQGFPDGYTAIPWRGKPASECPDGPRYKALGNSWAVPVVRWIGRRIDAAL